MAKRVTSVSTPTAHLIGPGKLKVINQRLAFSTGQGTPTRLDPASLRTLICYGKVGITDDAFAMLFDHGIEVSWMSHRGGQLRGRLASVDDRSARLRMLQHQRLADTTQKLGLAKEIVAQKVISQSTVARHYQRHGREEAGLFCRKAKRWESESRHATSVEQLRGIEGSSTRAWFSLYGKLFPPPWSFTQRVRRPPTDPVNALLSLAYTFLLRKSTARIQASGLEVNLGALHEYRPGRPSLACDLIEPLRAPVVDRWVLELCKQRQVQPADFVTDELGGMKLRREKFGQVLAAWEQHWIDRSCSRLVDQQVRAFIDALTDGQEDADAAI